MDQTVLAGVGNILATEGLWHARIDPRSQSNALARADIVKISRGLQTAIRKQLATRQAPEGEWHDVFAVYGRAGRPCPRCGAMISRVTVGGRTTAFCTQCQIRK
jgi:formamidopyrimidine-DNA glycosylase